MNFLEFVHKYMNVVDRIRSTREWLPVTYHGTPHVITPKFAKSGEVIQLDDKKFVHDKTIGPGFAKGDVGFAIFGLLGLVLPSGWFIIKDLLGVTGQRVVDIPVGVAIFAFIFALSCTLIPIPPIILAFVYPFRRPRKRLLIFDRENGTVTLPPRFWGEHEVVPFKDLKVKRIRNIASYVNFHVLAAFRPSDGQPIEFGLLQDNWKDWAFYCWYMDKDRPLPPGEVFDPYREQDEARRAREVTERIQKCEEEVQENLGAKGFYQGEVLLWKE